MDAVCLEGEDEEYGQAGTGCYGFGRGGVWALGMLLPASAVADEEAPGTRGIVIGLGEATPRSDGGMEFDVVRWVEDGTEVAPVPDVRVFADVAE